MIVIAIDGPAASGKSTLSSSLAALFGFQVIESGLFYRFIAHLMLQRVVAPADHVDVLNSLSVDPPDWSLLVETKLRKVMRDDGISAAVAEYSAIPGVRKVVNDNLRKIASHAPSVIEGRDIGTVVFPETPWKIFLNVSRNIREARRSAEGSSENLSLRDRADTQRVTAPLIAAPDAIILEIGLESPDEVLAKALQGLNQRGFSSESFTNRTKLISPS